MKRRAPLLCLFTLICLAGVSLAPAATNHTYATTVTIKVLDRAAHQIGGQVQSDAPAFFCSQGTVQVRRVERGPDPIVARVRMVYSYPDWRVKLPRQKGERVYGKVLKYDLPNRPITCLGSRSRAITVP